MKNKTLLRFIIISLILNVSFLASGILFAIFGHTQPYVAIFITLFMFTFHLDIRIIVGFIGSLTRKKIKIDRKIYQISKKEYQFLSLLRVKKWKDHLSNMFKDRFSLDSKDIKERLMEVEQNDISAELTHWIGAFLSLGAIPLGYLISPEELLVYIITSVLALFFDLPFILIQRFNRYRLQNILLKIKQ